MANAEQPDDHDHFDLIFECMCLDCGLTWCTIECIIVCPDCDDPNVPMALERLSRKN